ncbi:MAG: hypothetical protein AAF226_14910, partial [Verrucomicrobiota bacterium]
SDHKLYHIDRDFSVTATYQLPLWIGEGSALLPDSASGIVWLGAKKMTGISRVDTKKRTFERYHSTALPETNAVTSLFFDRTGLMWAGFAREGVFTLDTGASPMYQLRHSTYDKTSVPRGNILRIRPASEDRAWVLYHRGLVAVKTLPHNLPEIEHYPTFPKEVGMPLDFIEYRDQKILLSSIGLHTLSENNAWEPVDSFHQFKYRNRGTIQFDESGYAWITLGEELFQFDWSEQKIVHQQKLPTGPSHSAVIADHIWLGSYNKIFRYHIPTQSIENLTQPNSISCSGIVVAPDDTVWIAHSQGIHTGRSDLDYLTATPITEPTRFIALSPENSHIIYGTNTNVKSWDIHSQALASANPYTALDRLNMKAKNGVVLDNGDLVFGTYGSLCITDHREIVDVKPIDSGKTEFARLRHFQDGQDKRAIVTQTGLSKTDHIELKHSDHGLTFWVRMADYRLSGSQEFSFRVNDGKWSTPHPQPSLELASLPPGKHTVEARGYTVKGATPSATSLLDVTVTAPFYAHRSFKVAAIIALAGLLIGLVIYRFAFLARHAR